MFILYFFKACGWYFAYGLWFKQLDLKIQGSLMSQQKKDINFSTFSSHPPMALFSNILFSTYCMPGTVVILFSSVQFSSVAQSCPTLQPHGLQHIRLLCPSPPPRAYPNSCPLSPWCHPTISFSVVPFSSHLQSFPALGSFLISQFLASDGQSIGVFSFSISPSDEYSGLISFRIDWLDLLTVQGILKSLLQHHSPKASIL